ncbi:polyprenyl synthetase family protein [Streptomyces sp. NPDC093591]|uniref:polyprenyl synthetase family protein n=1 Tax=Streptomyces sp. NPDC093591 TaxID=3366044 RepID=UPI00380E228E
MIHVASLMHDDIIDGDQQRRGRDTAPRRFGQGFANALYMSAMQCLTECLTRGNSAEQVNMAWHGMSVTAEAMARGVAMELEIEDDLTCGRERYLEMARLKTAVLFGLSCRLGAQLGGGGQHADALDGFGTALGMAFQIRDDLLPYDGSPQDVGKDPASELRNHRPTLPVLLAHEHAGPERRARLDAVWRDPDAGGGLPRVAEAGAGDRRARSGSLSRARLCQAGAKVVGPAS